MDGVTRERQLEALASWLTDAVFDLDWDLNPEFYREIISRKLVKLGYVRWEDNVYVKTKREPKDE